MTVSVGVFCSSQENIAPSFLRQAVEIGEEAARRKYSLLIGGGLVSCMGAVLDGARNGGTDVRAVVPRIAIEQDPGLRLPGDVIVASDIWEWRREIARLADAFVVLPGGLGTLTELFETWSGRVLGVHEKPIVLVDSEGIFASLRDFVCQLVGHGLCRPQITDAVHWADSATAAFNYLDAQCRSVHPNKPDPR